MSFPTVGPDYSASTPSFRDPASPNHSTSPAQQVFSRSMAKQQTNHSQPEETKPLNIPESPPPSKAFQKTLLTTRAGLTPTTEPPKEEGLQFEIDV